MPEAKEGDKIKVHYEGKLEDGTVFDSSYDAAPLEFTLGQGMLIPGFEAAVVGMSKGDVTTVEIPSEEGYGERREEMVQVVEKKQLPEDIEPAEGMVLQVQTEGGQPLHVVITEIGDETITLDANHPLAGKDLTFKIEVVEIEEA